MTRRCRYRRASHGAPKEAPQLVPNLAAWFTALDASTITVATGVSEWRSKAGTISGAKLVQATTGNQPVYSPTALGGSKPGLTFDGTDDYLDVNSANDWAFLHDGTGFSLFQVYRIDSTGGATQRIDSNSNSSLEIGWLLQSTATNMRQWVQNGSGTNLNDWTNATAGHFERDVSRWQCWSYTTGTLRSRVSGSDMTNADTAGSPTSSNPTRVLRLGLTSGGGSPFKGVVCERIYYKRVITAAELSSLAAWANRKYGVTT